MIQDAMSSYIDHNPATWNALQDFLGELKSQTISARAEAVHAAVQEGASRIIECSS